MKTAMQELIEHLDIEMKQKGIIPNWDMYLEKEKEQIMNAYCDGAKGGANGNKGQHENGWVSIQMKENYYNQTYKTETNNL
jgi:hypothetical protein